MGAVLRVTLTRQGCQVKREREEGRNGEERDLTLHLENIKPKP
jgi:hypothetical protein